MNRLVLAALVSAGFAAAVPQASAQTAGTDARHLAQGPQHEQRAHRTPAERVEQRLERLKTALQITPQQEPQWNAFAEVRRKHAREATEQMTAFRSRMAERQQQGTRPTAIERLEFRQAMLATASVRLNETLAAVKPLYATLSPEQQKVADEMLAPRGHRGHHRGRGPGHA